MAGAQPPAQLVLANVRVFKWFKVGGSGRDTHQMNGVFNFTYTFDNGVTIGTQPSLSVNWKAPDEPATSPQDVRPPAAVVDGVEATCGD